MAKRSPTYVATEADLFPAPRTDQRQMVLRHDFNSQPLDAHSRRHLRTVQAVTAALERLCVTLGSQANAARHLDVSRQYVTQVLNGRKRPSDPMAVKLGFTPVTLYVRSLREEMLDGEDEGRLDAPGGDGGDGVGEAPSGGGAAAEGAGSE